MSLKRYLRKHFFLVAGSLYGITLVGFALGSFSSVVRDVGAVFSVSSNLGVWFSVAIGIVATIMTALLVSNYRREKSRHGLPIISDLTFGGGICCVIILACYMGYNFVLAGGGENRNAFVFVGFVIGIVALADLAYIVVLKKLTINRFSDAEQKGATTRPSRKLLQKRRKIRRYWARRG